jgi:hypothetical protein
MSNPTKILLAAASLLELLFEPEDGCIVFLLDIGELLPDHDMAVVRNLGVEELHQYVYIASRVSD